MLLTIHSAEKQLFSVYTKETIHNTPPTLTHTTTHRPVESIDISFESSLSQFCIPSGKS